MNKTVVKMFSFVCLLVLCSSLITTGLAAKCDYWTHENPDNFREYDPIRIEELYQCLDNGPWIDGNGNSGIGHNYEKIHHWYSRFCGKDIGKFEVFITGAPHTWENRRYSGGRDWETCSGCKIDRTLNHNCSYFKQEAAGRSYSGREKGDRNGHVNIYKLKEKCTACQSIRTTKEQREKVPHTYTHTVINRNPRLNLKQTKHTCTICGYYYTSNEPIDPSKPYGAIK